MRICPVTLSLLLCLVSADLAGAWPQAQGGSADSGASDAAGAQEEVVLGRPSTLDLGAAVEDRVLVEAGSVLRAQPDHRSTSISRIDAETSLPVVEKRGQWVRVRYLSWKGWIHLEGTDPGGAAPGKAASMPPDPGALAAARQILQRTEHRSHLGSFTLFTDVEDAAILQRLDAIASDVPRAYRDRYSLDPGHESLEAIVLFSREEDYRAFEQQVSQIGSLETLGHVSRGLVATFAGTRGQDEIERVLVHELTHVLNRRLFDHGLPPWLEEGMADDLAYSRFEASGHLDTGSLGGSSAADASSASAAQREEGYVVLNLDGPHAALYLLVSNWNSPLRPPAGDLIQIPWEEFVQPDLRETHYAESAFLVRFMLDEANEQLARQLRDLLRKIATSDKPQVNSGVDQFGFDLPGDLDNELYFWLLLQANTQGVPLPSPS